MRCHGVLRHDYHHDAQMAKGHLEAYPFIMDTVNVAAFLGKQLLPSCRKRLHAMPPYACHGLQPRSCAIRREQAVVQPLLP